MAELSEQTLKGYQIHERIGAGGFGAVFRAFQPIIERDVVIKAILAEFANRPEFIRRFEAEAQLVARLEHPFIVPLYDYWRDPEGAYLVMRLLRGGSLTKAIDEKGAFDPESAAKLLEQIGSALATAHRNNVVHRDIKPDNILLDESGNAYLTDFGISTIVGHEASDEEGVSGTIRYIAPEQLRQEPDAITIDIYSLGIVMFEVLTGSHPFNATTTMELLMMHLNDPLPHLHDVRDDLPEALNEIIQKATAKEPADRYQSTIEMATAFRQSLSNTIDLSEGWKIDIEHLVNPFKGLRAFQEADAGDFFGRSQLIKRLLSALENQRFIAVIGPSGSGKSSVVKAGLIPVVRKGQIEGSDNWYVTDMTPGAHPFEELETALMGISANPAVPFALIFKQSDNGISETVKLALPTPDSQLVLVIDQFEELFTMVESEEERARFLNGLLMAVNDPESCLRLIITLRADFYDRPLLYPGFGELVREHMETVMPLSRNELEEVIAYPIAASGALMEAGLSELIISDVEEQPGALPLLQYALTELFERHENGTLTSHAYKEIGGVLGALAGRAEEVFRGLDRELQAVARQLFLRLISLGEGSNDTRRRVSREELTAFDNQQLNAVLDAFGKARLLTFDRDPITRTPTVEVAHEALIHRWTMLRDWIETSREDIRLHRRLMSETQDWLGAKRDAGFLVTDSRLEQYDNWSKTTDIILNENEKAYLSAALERRYEERKRDEARKAREVELQKNAYRRLWYLVATMAVFLVVAVGLSGFALTQRDEAQTARSTSDSNAATAVEALDLSERRAAESNSLALASQSMLELNEYNTDLAISLGLQANQLDNPPVLSQSALRNAAYAPGTRSRCMLEDAQIVAEAFNADASLLLTSTWDNQSSFSFFTLYDIASCEILQQSQIDNFVVTAIVFTNDGKTALYTTLNLLTQASGNISLWDVIGWSSIYEKQGLGYSFHIGLSPDESRALIDYVQNGVMIWDVLKGEQVQLIRQPYYLSTFLADGKQAISADAQTALLWDTQTGDVIRKMATPPQALTSLSLSPDEKYAIGGTNFAVLVMWDLSTGEILRDFYGHSEEIYDLAFMPDGKQFLSASADNSIRLWDVETGLDVYRFDGHKDAVKDLVLLPDKRQLVSWSLDNTVRIWDLQNASQIKAFMGHPVGVNGVAVSPDGKLIASGDVENGLYLWDAESGEILHQFSGAQFTHRISFSPDGSSILVSALNGLYAYDVIAYELLWSRTETGFTDAQYSADGKSVFATAFNQVSGGIYFLNAETGEVISSFNNTAPVLSGDFVGDSGNALFTAGTQMCLWDGTSSQISYCIAEHDADIWQVRSNADGTRAITASYDGSVGLWDTATGDEIHRFIGHSAPVLSVWFSPDEKSILSASADGSIRIWNIETGEELRRINWTADIWSAMFMPDGETVITGSEDGLVSLWSIKTLAIDELIEWVEDNRYVMDEAS